MTLVIKNPTRFLFCFFLTLMTWSVLAQLGPDIFISSRDNDSVKRYSSANGSFLGDFITPNSGGLDRPQEVLFHPHTGHLLVTGFTNSEIKLYNGQTGDFIENFTSATEYSLI